MDFSFTAEQEELRAQARSFLAERFPPERVAELADSEQGWDRDSWRELAELGWLGVSVPEELGGAGLGFLEEAVIFEELGRALYPGPYFATVALALPVLTPELQAQVARGEATWTLALAGDDAPDTQMADRVATLADGRVVTSDNGTTTTLRDDGDAVLATVRRRALAALALEAVGIAQRALELGVEHARTREQFGRPIGSYQAVSYPLADTYVETELARSLAYWAAWAHAEDDEQADVAVAAAKSYAGDVAVAACERSIQVHGGIGFTWEHDLHWFLKRARTNAALFGSAREHRDRVAELAGLSRSAAAV